MLLPQLDDRILDRSPGSPAFMDEPLPFLARFYPARRFVAIKPRRSSTIAFIDRNAALCAQTDLPMLLHKQYEGFEELTHQSMTFTLKISVLQFIAFVNLERSRKGNKKVVYHFHENFL